MVLDIKMCRFDNVPWGFRLVGGSDFEFPLTVVKVTEGSIAEEAGLRVGDVIVRIDDTPTSPLTHDETNKLIHSCGNVFYFGVQRDDAEQVNEPKQFPVVETNAPTTDDASYQNDGSVTPLTEQNVEIKPNEVQETLDYQKQASPMPVIEVAEPQVQPSEEHSTQQQQQPECLLNADGRPCSVLSENSEIKIVEEEIAAVLSGESEVLPEHNGVMGVNFYRIFPKPGVCMSSDVLRSLNEEAIKTKAEKDKENKKWSTFLQKPNRPIPKSKLQIEAEKHAANAYKVKIVKSAPIDRERTPPPPSPKPAEPPKEPTPPPAKEKTPEKTAEELEEEQRLPTDNEVPNLIETNEENADTETEKMDEEKTVEPERSASPSASSIKSIESAKVQEEAAEIEPASPATPPKTEEELALERQLADVQRQLAALSSLPSTIQSTLDAVTKQLAEMLPAFKLQQATPKVESEPREIYLERIDEQETNEEMERCLSSASNSEKQQQSAENGNEIEEGEQNLKDDMEVASLDNKKCEEQQQRRQIREHETDDTESDEAEHLKKQKIALWNRLFSGENISRQHFRVNFMKYQKPEKRIDLNRSEVYKIIHHLDRQPVRGIEVRPPVVPAEIDIRKAVPS